jgi:hypothetical protein
MVMKHVVMSQEAGFFREFGADVDEAVREGRKYFARWPGEVAGWRDAKVAAVFSTGAMVSCGKLFRSRAHYEGYVEGMSDALRPAEADVAVNTEAAAQ